MRRFAVLVFVSGFLGGCAGGKGEAPPATPNQPAAAGAAESSNSDKAAEKVQRSTTDAPAGAPATTGPSHDVRSNRLRALAAAEDQIALAGHACVDACRALSSMKRASDQLCELSSDPSDKTVCEDAQARFAKAQKRVVALCGVCPVSAP